MSTTQNPEIIKGASVIKKRIQNQINGWNEDKLSALLYSSVRDAKEMMGRKQENLDSKERAKVFYTMFCRGEISAAICYISKRGKGRVLLPGECDEKSSDEVWEVLRPKHPEGRNMKSDKIPMFDNCQDILDIEVSEAHVEQVGAVMQMLRFFSYVSTNISTIILSFD